MDKEIFTNQMKNQIYIKIVWLLVGALCFFLFYFRYDPSVLIVSGNLLLDGHLHDYYEQIEGVIGKAGIYPIPNPIFYAIWNIPVRILTGTSFTDLNNIPMSVLYWNKLMIVLAYALTGRELGHTIVHLKGKEGNLHNIWFFMPVSFFVTFMMGMYDIWYVFFMALGLKYYFSSWEQEGKKNKYYFLICFGFSICFKTLPVFYFLPLLLAREKKIHKAVLDIFLFAVPYAICAIPYLSSESFINNCLKFSGNSSSMLLASAFGNIVPLIVFLLVIYGYAYFKIHEGPDFSRKVIYMCNFVSCVIFGFAIFHPQWFLMAMLFFALLFAYTDEEKSDIMLILHFALAFVYFILFAAKKNYFDSSQGLLETGILGSRGLDILKRNECFTLDKLYVINNLEIICSVFLGVMLCIVLFSHEKGRNCVREIASSKRMAMLLASLAVFIFPSVSCYLPIWPEYIYANEVDFNQQCSAVEINRLGAAQYFSRGNAFTISKIIFRTYTWGNSYDAKDQLSLRISKADKDEILYEESLLLKDMPDNDLVEVAVPDLKLSEGDYKIDFSTEMVDTTQAFALSKQKVDRQDSGDFLELDGSRIEGEGLQIQIIGRIE